MSSPPSRNPAKIVAELEQDLAAVAGAKRLKAKMEANIRADIGRVWGDKSLPNNISTGD